MRWLSIVVLTLGYGAALLITKVTRKPRVAQPAPPRRILVIGTFHNPNWFLAHIVPLVKADVAEIVLVSDGFTADLPGVKLVTPPGWACRLLTRAGAKFVFAAWYSLRFRPSLFMGYAIFPAATTALILGRLFGRPSCFQLTSGPLELAGGGFHAENRLLAALGRPSPWIESLAHALTREFTLLVVRGSQAAEYVRNLGYDGRIEVITGSIEIPESRPPYSVRATDLVFVGRLTERKRPFHFINVVEHLVRDYPGLKAVMIGDGPLTQDLSAAIDRAGLGANIELAGLQKNVLDWVGRSKVFVLTSRWEGVSIAMLEAMAVGTVPVVNDVGDLRDVVVEGENGYLVTDDRIETFVAGVSTLLASPAHWEELSNAAFETARRRCGRDAIAARWRTALLPFLGAEQSAPNRDSMLDY
jgi:glycosyltransferase involved in cell wall biosynthesis